MSDVELIDSHCHLIFENFEKDLEDVFLRLRSRGVKKLVHACCELTEIPKLKKISKRENDLDNCILLNDKKMVCDFINGNLFYIKNEKIYTPDLKSGCLNGVLRKNLINIIKSNGLVIEESQISPFDLVSADELFITNVIQGILPVTNYRKKTYVNKTAIILNNLLNDSINYN